MAQDQATRHFGDAPPTPWVARAGPRASTRWALLGGAGVVVAGLAAGGWALAQSRMPQPALAPPLAAAPEPATEVLPPTMARPQAPVQRAVAAAAPAPAWRVVRAGGVWHIRAEAAPRHEVARELAALSGTALPIGADALRAAAPLNLRWDGDELAQAWRAVIGDEASYALHCHADRCTAWIVDPGPAAQESAAPPAPAGFAAAERSAYD